MLWLLVPAGYLLGSIPTGVLLGRLAGRDPRRAGSGNIGATNVTRTLGRKWGAVTLLVDALKGFLPAWGALQLEAGTGIAAAVGFAAVAGHCFPVWLRLQGGKGVATAFGVMLAFSPVAVLLGVLAWVACLLLVRVPAVGSLVAASIFVAVAAIERRPLEVQVLTLALWLLIFYRHIGNMKQIADLLRGRRKPRRLVRPPRPPRRR